MAKGKRFGKSGGGSTPSGKGLVSGPGLQLKSIAGGGKKVAKG